MILGKLQSDNNVIVILKTEELALKSCQSVKVVKNRNVNTVWVIFQENRRITREEIAASTNKTSRKR